jgi:serine phosphatase RsbU (regulator of sigma subunit)
MPLFGVAILVLHRLRKIFRRLIEGRPFAADNAKSLRFIGIAVVVGELVWASFVYWSTRIVVSNFTASGVTLHTDFPVRAPVILAGLVLLIVAEVFREGAQMKADLEAAREIQFSLVSDIEYQLGPVSIHSEMRPADAVGGDYYDVIDLGDGRIAFVLGDVAGHGLPAALLMALLQGSLRSLISSGLRGADLIAKLNTYLVANTPSNRMVTFFYGELDPATGQLNYINAGHNPPYLYDGSGMTRLGSTSVFLGAFDGAPFTEASVELRDGARLLIFTDGITEAANPVDEEFGEDRLEMLIGERGQTAPASLIEAGFAKVIKFCGKATPADDMTMMVVSRSSLRPSSSSSAFDGA